jgi:hypothetical protein
MTADKFSVLIKYSYLDIAKNARLSDEDFGLLMKGIIDYDKTGKEPKFKKQNLSIAFSFIKCDLDSNRKKWEARVIANQTNGKKGGRPPKAPENPKNPVGYLETQQNPAKPKKPDSGNGGGSGNDYDLEFDSGGIQPPPSIENIKKESGAWGFFIDNAIGQKFLESGIEPSWFIGPHSYLEFCAASVRQRYPKKDEAGLKRLYIVAVPSWDDLREAYPQWKEDQEEQARVKEKNEAYKKAKDNKPKICQCGGTLDSRLICPLCKGTYFFNEENLNYYFDPLDEDTIRENDEFRKKLGKNSG